MNSSRGRNKETSSFSDRKKRRAVLIEISTDSHQTGGGDFTVQQPKRDN